MPCLDLQSMEWGWEKMYAAHHPLPSDVGQVGDGGQAYTVYWQVLYPYPRPLLANWSSREDFRPLWHRRSPTRSAAFPGATINSTQIAVARQSVRGFNTTAA